MRSIIQRFDNQADANNLLPGQLGFYRNPTEKKDNESIILYIGDESGIAIPISYTKEFILELEKQIEDIFLNLEKRKIKFIEILKMAKEVKEAIYEITDELQIEIDAAKQLAIQEISRLDRKIDRMITEVEERAVDRSREYTDIENFKNLKIPIIIEHETPPGLPNGLPSYGTGNEVQEEDYSKIYFIKHLNVSAPGYSGMAWLDERNRQGSAWRIWIDKSALPDSEDGRSLNQSTLKFTNNNREYIEINRNSDFILDLIKQLQEYADDQANKLSSQNLKIPKLLIEERSLPLKGEPGDNYIIQYLNVSFPAVPPSFITVIVEGTEREIPFSNYQGRAWWNPTGSADGEGVWEVSRDRVHFPDNVTIGFNSVGQLYIKPNSPLMENIKQLIIESRESANTYTDGKVLETNGRINDLEGDLEDEVKRLDGRIDLTNATIIELEEKVDEEIDRLDNELADHIEECEKEDKSLSDRIDHLDLHKLKIPKRIEFESDLPNMNSIPPIPIPQHGESYIVEKLDWTYPKNGIQGSKQSDYQGKVWWNEFIEGHIRWEVVKDNFRYPDEITTTLEDGKIAIKSDSPILNEIRNSIEEAEENLNKRVDNLCGESIPISKTENAPMIKEYIDEAVGDAVGGGNAHNTNLEAHLFLGKIPVIIDSETGSGSRLPHYSGINPVPLQDHNKIYYIKNLNKTAIGFKGIAWLKEESKNSETLDWDNMWHIWIDDSAMPDEIKPGIVVNENTLKFTGIDKKYIEINENSKLITGIKKSIKDIEEDLETHDNYPESHPYILEKINNLNGETLNISNSDITSIRQYIYDNKEEAIGTSNDYTDSIFMNGLKVPGRLQFETELPPREPRPEKGTSFIIARLNITAPSIPERWIDATTLLPTIAGAPNSVLDSDFQGKAWFNPDRHGGADWEVIIDRLRNPDGETLTLNNRGEIAIFDDDKNFIVKRISDLRKDLEDLIKDLSDENKDFEPENIWPKINELFTIIGTMVNNPESSFNNTTLWASIIDIQNIIGNRGADSSLTTIWNSINTLITNLNNKIRIVQSKEEVNNLTLNDKDLTYTRNEIRLFIKDGNETKELYNPLYEFENKQQITGLKNKELVYNKENRHLFYQEGNNLRELYVPVVPEGVSRCIQYGFNHRFVERSLPGGGIPAEGNEYHTFVAGRIPRSRFDLNFARDDSSADNFILRFAWVNEPEVTTERLWRIMVAAVNNDQNNSVYINTHSTRWTGPGGAAGDIGFGLFHPVTASSVRILPAASGLGQWSTIKTESIIQTFTEEFNFRIIFNYFNGNLSVPTGMPTGMIYEGSVTITTGKLNLTDQFTVPQLNIRLNTYRTSYIDTSLMTGNPRINLIWDPVDFK